MFNDFMSRSLPLWLLISAMFPLLVAAMIFRAAFRIRHLRIMLHEANRLRTVSVRRAEGVPQLQTTESEDWAASP